MFHNALHTGSDSNKEFGLHTFPKYVLQQAEEARDATLPTSSRLLAPASTSSDPTRGPLPKNCNIGFGAHRSSVYGTTMAHKTTALTAAAKDQDKETHANDLMTRPARPRNLHEEFPGYQKLLDTAEVEPTPLTLPGLPATIQAQASSRQKR
jgi:hypothetical protein